MAQLWGGRFTKQTDEAVKAFKRKSSHNIVSIKQRKTVEELEARVAEIRDRVSRAAWSIKRKKGWG